MWLTLSSFGSCTSISFQFLISLAIRKFQNILGAFIGMLVILFAMCLCVDCFHFSCYKKTFELGTWREGSAIKSTTYFQTAALSEDQV